MQREAPFALKGLALWRARKAGSLDLQPRPFQRREEDVVLVVGDLADDDAIHDRRLNQRRRSPDGASDS